MRSLFAALRTLTLPAGVTSGQRIVLDGINGLILVYDANNDLIAYMAPRSGVEPGGKPYDIGMGIIPRNQGVSSNGLTAISLNADSGNIIFSYNPNSGAVPFDTDGLITGFNPDSDDNENAYLFFAAPATNADGVQMELELDSRSKDGTVGHKARISPNFFASDATANATRVQIAGFLERITMASHSYTVETWKNLTYANSYVGGQYKLFPDGEVRFRANINSGTAGVPIKVATIPAGYRPLTYAEFACARTGGYGSNKVTVDTNGDVMLWTNDGLYNAWLEQVRYSIF